MEFDQKRFRVKLRQLREDYPTDQPVIVRTRPHRTIFLNGFRVYGYCYYSEKSKRFVIIIERNPDTGIMIDTLWHEWSHVLTWKSATTTHCKKFWSVYGAIYRRYQDGEV